MKRLNNALIVDDDPSWRQITAEILQDQNCNVTMAGTKADAEKLINFNRYDLAVLDLSLSAVDHKNTDGFQLLQLIRQIDPECKCIMMTGFATVDIAVKAIVECGAINFFRKESLSIADFIGTLKNHFQLDDLQDSLTNSTTDPITEQPASRFSGSLPALVIEDDPDWRSVHTEVLSTMGLGYVECASYGQAIGQLSRSQFSVILLDLTLTPSNVPDSNERETTHMEGIKLLDRIRDIKTPIIIISGLSSPEKIDAIFQGQNIFAFFEKSNFDQSLLIRAISDSLAEPTGYEKGGELTQREAEVLELVTQGLTNKEIAVQLFITPNTVKRHLKSIFQKMDVHTRSGAVAKAIGK